MIFKAGVNYLLAYISILIASFGLIADGWASWLFPFYAFFMVPVLELVLPASTKNHPVETEKKLAESRIFDWLIYLIVPAQWAMLVLFVNQVTEDLAFYELAGKIVTFGIACGVFGINVGHELGHRSKWYEQWMAKALLLSSLYMHFFIEHNRGHHKHVATVKDPATAKYGQMLYSFWARSVFSGYISAWNLEFNRLRKKNRAKFHWTNQMIHYFLFQFFLLLIIFLVFDAKIMLYYWISAIFGILLLETVNYIEHYGLMRKTGPGGNFLNVLPVHSWNSNHPLGRSILFELSRHSDHHYNASRKYQILRHFNESPQMPSGYPGMMVLALIPPLWFKVMHPELNRLYHTYSDVLYNSKHK